EEVKKAKGPTAVIETANLNRDGPKKTNLKATSEAANAKPELTRRERYFPHLNLVESTRWNKVHSCTLTHVLLWSTMVQQDGTASVSGDWPSWVRSPVPIA